MYQNGPCFLLLTTSCLYLELKLNPSHHEYQIYLEVPNHTEHISTSKLQIYPLQMNVISYDEKGNDKLWHSVACVIKYFYR